MENITVDGIEYAPIGNGNRAIVVVDRGWIFAGDVVESNGRIVLRRAVWVFRWSSIGFSRVITEPENNNVDIRKIDDIDIPSSSELFRVPVSDDWGLE